MAATTAAAATSALSEILSPSGVGSSSRSSTTSRSNGLSGRGRGPLKGSLLASGNATAATAATAAATTTTTRTTTTTSVGDLDPTKVSEEQLSNDLALFLSNPSLKAALADGSLDLASYSSTVEEELSELETKCIAVYRDKAEDIRRLQTELEQCDSILLGLQEMLLGFQADLGGLSGDIRQLQSTSKTLGVQLGNRKAAEEGLRRYLRHVVLSPHLAQAICKGPVNALFQQSVHELMQIYHDTHDTTPQDWSCGTAPAMTVAGQEMQSHVQQLSLVAVSRIRDFFLQQMTMLRKPQTNIRMIQSHGLLHYSDLYDFLDEAAPDIAKEIFTAYTDTMSKTMYALFRTYQAQLIQLDSTRFAATRQDVLAMEDSLMRDTITTKAKKRVDVFTLGNRANMVLQTQESPILAHVALSEHQRYPYERLFKSCLLHLLDAVTNEHVVCRQFFKRDAFLQLFPPTLGLLLEQLENYLFGCHDALCLLLMIKLTHQFRRMAKTRTIHSLDSFFDQITHLLWPRLNTIMEAHLRSIKQATAVKLGGVDLHAHYVSRRFAEFTCSILLILHKGTNHPSTNTAANTSNSGTTTSKGATSKPSLAKQRSVSTSSGAAGATSPYPVKRSISSNAATPTTTTSSSSSNAPTSAGDMLLKDLNQLLDEFVALLERLSEEHVSNKKRIVFMINNLDQIVCIFQERRVAGKELNRVIELLMVQRELFVEEELLHGFSKMIAFVQQTEAHLAFHKNNTTNSAAGTTLMEPLANIQVVEALVREFASNWRQGIEAINRNVLSYFSNFRNGMEILKQVLTQLLLYYTRFQDVIRKVLRKNGGGSSTASFWNDLVPTTVILAEIKKYALAI